MRLATAAEGGLVLPDDDTDIARIGQLFDAHQREMYQFARRLGGTRDEARDLVQEAFVRLLQARPSPLTEDLVRGWLYRTLVNLCRDRRRRLAVRSRFHDAPHEPAGTGDSEARLVARLAVERALLQLNVRRRAVVVLHEVQGESVADIARLLGIAPVTVRWHLSRARRLLSAVLA